MRILIATIALALFAPLASAQDRTLPPDASAVALPPVTGKGVQIYRCEQQEGTPAWVFVAPEATLESASGERVGTHGAGPTWRWKDGSAVVGKLLQKQPSPDGKAIPWLLLSTTPAPDNKTGSVKAGGALDGVTYVRRSETHGGTAPDASGCDSSHGGGEARVPYTATYTFYKNKQQR